MDDNLVVALFRHGLTEENKRKAYLGWSDSSLCTDVSETIVPIDKHYDLYFSSNLGRCTQTAELLFPDKKLFMIPELREMNFGVWEGHTYADLKGNSDYRKWLSDPYSVSPPDGEHFTHFRERVLSGWKKVLDLMLEKDANSAAVVTHGGVIRHLLTEHAPLQKSFWEWDVPHGCGFELTCNRKSVRRGNRCTSLLEVPITARKRG